MLICRYTCFVDKQKSRILRANVLFKMCICMYVYTSIPTDRHTKTTKYRNPRYARSPEMSKYNFSWYLYHMMVHVTMAVGVCVHVCMVAMQLYITGVKKVMCYVLSHHHNSNLRMS